MAAFLFDTRKPWRNIPLQGGIMLFAIIALCLPVGPVEQDAAIPDMVQAQLSHLARLDKELTDLSRNINRGFVKNLDGPATGLVIESAEKVGPDGLHAAMVMAVFRDSPAYIAGIQPGDRIVAVGTRKIEHETDLIIYSLVDGSAGKVDVSILHGESVRHYAIDRKPLLCISRAVASVNKTVCLSHVTSLLEQVRTLKKLLESRQDLTYEDLASTAHNIEELWNLLGKLSEPLNALLNEVAQVTFEYCQPETQ